MGINNELLLKNKEELNTDRNASNEKEILSDEQGKLTDNENPVEDKMINILDEENGRVVNEFPSEKKEILKM